MYILLAKEPKLVLLWVAKVAQNSRAK